MDQEYKPGVDALTADLYFGTSSQLSLITAYADEDPVVDAEDWAVDGMVYVLYGQHTVGRSDVGLMLGEVRNDAVVGLTIASSIGPVAVHADATYTQPDSPEEDPFVRGVVGALWAATGDLTLSGELYHQSLGAENPDGYLSQLRTERYARGELWLAGQTYASGSVSYQVTPLIRPWPSSRTPPMEARSWHRMRPSVSAMRSRLSWVGYWTRSSARCRRSVRPGRLGDRIPAGRGTSCTPPSAFETSSACIRRACTCR